MPRVAGVVLAAGRGTRMGRPKALLPWGRDTLVTRAIRIWSAVCDPVIVVGGARFNELEERVAGRAKLVFNPSFDAGMITSVQAGLGAVPPSCTAALVGPVDQALATGRVLAALVAAHEDTPEDALVPEHQGLPGHPVLLPADALSRLASAPKWSTLAAYLDAPETRTRRVRLDFPEVTRNLNTPEAYRAFLKEALAAEAGGGWS